LRAEVCVGAAIFREGRLLLLRRSKEVPYPELWEIPGGHVEKGERLESALRREVREETGLEIRVGPPFYAWEYQYPKKGGRRVDTIEIDFHCSARSRRAPLLDPREHSQFDWVAREDLGQYRTDAVLDKLHRRAFASRDSNFA
jgi:mutator protein MutT